MRVFCSGISGAGASEHIAKVADYATARGEEIKEFNMGQEVFNAAKRSGYPITPAGVLDLDKRALNYLTLAAYETIASQIGNYENSIIDAHIHFCWRGVLTDSVKPEMVRALDPDVYVTLMDLAQPIMERLKADNAQWRSQVENEGLDKRSVLHLQTAEVSTTRQFAGFLEKPMYVLPSKDSPDSLYKIATASNVEVAYASFPITSFYNDLEWLVGGSTQRVFVYFPKKVRSSGVHSEATKAKGSCKEVWFVGPEDMRDPFTDANIHQRFYSPDACIAKLLESGMERE